VSNPRLSSLFNFGTNNTPLATITSSSSSFTTPISAYQQVIAGTYNDEVKVNQVESNYDHQVFSDYILNSVKIYFKDLPGKEKI